MLPALVLTAALLAQDTPPAQTTPPASGSAVSVDAYKRDYEGPKTDSEMRYDSGILSAYSSKVGQMEGSWVIAANDGRKLVGLELRSDNVVSGRIEGAWRSMLAGFGLNESGFVSDVSLTGRDLEINYFQGRARSPTILHLHKDNDGTWRGSLMDVMGRKTPVTMSKVGAGG